jgi:hypothetical protein
MCAENRAHARTLLSASSPLGRSHDGGSSGARRHRSIFVLDPVGLIAVSVP